MSAVPAPRAAGHPRAYPHDDGWAIHALPPGTRDLGCTELWTRSLARSRHRREAAAARSGGVSRGTAAKASIALATATLLAPVTQSAQAARHATASATVLHRGDRGSDVAAAQRALGIPADGVYGPQTRHAVRRYQRAHGLTVDGIVGPQTLAALGVSGGETDSATSAPAGSGARAAVAAARSRIGDPYASGGTHPGGFDCSGLTQWAMRRAGISIPRTSYDQYGAGTAVSRRSIQPGDLVFFDTGGGGASHVGIATSGTTAISATTHGVMEHSIRGGYWGSHYVGARRVA